jgi:hypothetical protein
MSVWECVVCLCGSVLYVCVGVRECEQVLRVCCACRFCVCVSMTGCSVGAVYVYARVRVCLSANRYGACVLCLRCVCMREHRRCMYVRVYILNICVVHKCESVAHVQYVCM